MLAREEAKITDRKEEGGATRAERDHECGRGSDFCPAGCLVDVLVNDAGVGAGKNIEKLTLDDWRWVMSVNPDGVFLGTKCAIGAMTKSGGGSIINMSSIEGMVSRSVPCAYDAS